MMRIVLTGVSLLAVFLTLAGCRTALPAAKPPVKPGVSATAPSPAGPANSRSDEQQAEADARFMAGVIPDVNDEPEAALEDFYKAARADIGNELLVLDLSTRFILLKHYDQALALLHKALAQPGASALLDSRLGFVQLAMGNTNAAIASHRNAMGKAPRSIAGYESLFHLYRQTGQTNQALQILEQAAKVANPEAEFLVELSEMYYLQSRATQGTNDVFRARAKEALKRAAKLNPTNFFVLQKLADGLTQNGERKQATVILRKIRELYPDLPSIRERLVNLLWSERDRKGASEQLEALIRENPTDPQAYYLLGMIAFDDQRYKEAVDSFHKTLLLKPDFEPAYYELAVCKVNLDQPKEALEILAKARERFKDTFLVEYCSALAYTRQKDYTNALQRLTAAEVIASATDTNRLTHVFPARVLLGTGRAVGGRGKIPEEVLENVARLLRSPELPGLHVCGESHESGRGPRDDRTGPQTGA
ncbi:MAG: tetratricopeptide repeat protein [Verrucomicrobia bacterium]|nr:tetratricopeptide repeat protein [Verrucomicrobiota bacterium]